VGGLGGQHENACARLGLTVEDDGMGRVPLGSDRIDGGK
jgi:hypothetical protein